MRQTGGRGQYGHVKIEIEPTDPSTPFEFENAIVGGAIPKEFIGAVEKGIKEAEYDAWLISIGAGDQFGSGFVAVNPNSKIPALMDHSATLEKPQRIFESGAMLMSCWRLWVR